MKKLMVLLLAAALLLSAAVCFGQTAASLEALAAIDAAATDEIHVVIWGTWGPDTPRGGWLADRATEFSAMFDHVNVEYVSQGNYAGINEKITQGAAAGDLPTLFYVEEAVVPGYNDLTMDLREVLPEETIDNYLDGLMVSLIAEDGKVMAVPMSRSLSILYVNESLLEEAGWKGEDIETIDDMLTAAKAVYEATGVPGFSLFWDSDCWFFESMIYAYGGQVLSDDGQEVTFGEDYDYVGAKYMEAVQEGLIEGWIAQTYTAAQPDTELKLKFQNGEVAMMLFSNNNFTAYQQALEDNGYKMSLQLQPEGTERSIVSGGGNWMLANTAAPAEAMMAGGWLQYIASDENVLSWTDLCGAFIITESAYESETAQEMFEENPNHLKVYETMNYLHKRVNTPYWVEMYTYMHDKLSQFALYPESTDIYATVDDMANKCAQIIEDNAW